MTTDHVQAQYQAGQRVAVKMAESVHYNKAGTVQRVDAYEGRGGSSVPIYMVRLDSGPELRVSEWAIKPEAAGGTNE